MTGFLSVRETATRLGLTPGTVRGLVARGGIPALRLRGQPRGPYYIPAAGLDRAFVPARRATATNSADVGLRDVAAMIGVSWARARELYRRGDLTPLPRASFREPLRFVRERWVSR